MKRHKYSEELQNRTIKPSSDSWEKLNTKLSEHENQERDKSRPFLKYAAAILILISVSLYFYQPNEGITNKSIIVSPTLKEDLKTIPAEHDETQTEIVVTPSFSPVNKAPEKEFEFHIKKELDEEKVLVEKIAIYEQTHEQEISINDSIETPLIQSAKEEPAIAKAELSEEQVIDNEVEQLLNKTKIELIRASRFPTKKEVSAHALLNEVEADLDKALKKILFEKIEKTLKNPKEVVTSRDN